MLNLQNLFDVGYRLEFLAAVNQGLKVVCRGTGYLLYAHVRSTSLALLLAGNRSFLVYRFEAYKQVHDFLIVFLL